MTLPTAQDARSFAITEILRLMQTYDVSPHDIATLNTNENKASALSRVMSYVGGILVLAGLCTYIGMQWAKFDALLHVAITFGPGFIALILGIIVARQDRNSHVATPLFVLSALFQTTGLFVFLDEYASGNDGVMAVLVVCTIMALQYLAIFIALRRPSILLLTLIFAHFAFAALFEKMGIQGRYSSLILGLSGLMIASSLSRTRFMPISGLGFVFSGFTFTSAFYVIFERTPFDIALIGVAAFMVYASVLNQSRSLLFVAIVTMLGYLGYYTKQYFSGMVGWPVALIILGLIMIVSASYAVRLGRNFARTR
jgi:hypothetical protein